MKKDSFFSSLIDTISFFWIEFLGLLFEFLSGIAGLLITVDIILVFISPVISVVYWCGYRMIGFISLSLGAWLFPLIWIISIIIAIIVFAYMDYYDKKHPTTEHHYSDLSGWPD